MEEKKHPKILMKIVGFGEITAELYPEKAPITVKNFLNLVDSGFYNGLIFHRVINGFMLQGGGFLPDFTQKQATSIRGEFKSNGCKTNDLAHKRGVLSMARTNVPDSASSQFFIMHKDAPHLDGQYAAFGMVTDGFKVIDKIAELPTTRYQYYSDVPAQSVVIESVSVVSE